MASDKEEYFDVDFSFYCDGMCRTVVTSEEIFNTYKENAVVYVRNLMGDGLIVERVADGLKKAVCMMIEDEFIAEKSMSENAAVASESVGDYKVSYDNSRGNMIAERNAKSLDRRRYERLKSYCVVTNGRR